MKTIESQTALCVSVSVLLVAACLALASPAQADVAFARVDHAIGAQAPGVAAGDFDSDGDVDLAVANTADDEVAVLFNEGDGVTFTRTDIPSGSATTGAGRRPVAIVATDLFADGDIDLALANGDDTVSVIINRGLAANPFPFGASVHSVGNCRGPRDIAAGDLNRDGFPDLAVACALDDTVLFMHQDATALGDGVVNFIEFEVGVGDFPAGVAISHLDERPFLDVAVANIADGTVSVLRSIGEGGSFARSDFDVGADPVNVAAVDLDGDGAADLAVTNHSDNEVSILRNNGSGTDFERTDTPTGQGPEGIAATDLDGDGDHDLAVTNRMDDDVSVLVNSGTGTEFDRFDAAVASEPVDVEPGDLDGDGAPDLAVANVSAGSVSVLRSLPIITTTPQALDFGPQFVGAASAARSVTLTNDGAAPASITGVAVVGTNPGDFQIASDGCQGRTLRAGGNCSVDVRFAPTASGARSAQLRFSHTGPGSPREVPLSGVGAETADLAVSIAATPSPVPSGDNLTYRITVKNFGPDVATGVHVHHTLPPETGFVSASECSEQLPPGGTGTLDCALAPIDPGQTRQLQTEVEVLAPAGSSIRSTATVSSFTDDPTAANDSATVATSVIASPPDETISDMSVSIEDTPDPIRNGQLLTYTVAMQNLGPDVATGRRLSLALPSAAQFQSVDSGIGSCSTPPVGFTGTVSCTFSPAGGVGGFVTIRVVVKIVTTNRSPISATATGSSDGSDPNPANNSATAVTEIRGGPR